MLEMFPAWLWFKFMNTVRVAIYNDIQAKNIGKFSYILSLRYFLDLLNVIELKPWFVAHEPKGLSHVSWRTNQLAKILCASQPTWPKP
jgi:hypothetical protein